VGVGDGVGVGVGDGVGVGAGVGLGVGLGVGVGDGAQAVTRRSAVNTSTNKQRFQCPLIILPTSVSPQGFGGDSYYL